MAVVVVNSGEAEPATQVVTDWSAYLSHRWAMENMDVIADLLIKTMRLRAA